MFKLLALSLLLFSCLPFPAFSDSGPKAQYLKFVADEEKKKYLIVRNDAKNHLVNIYPDPKMESDLVFKDAKGKDAPFFLCVSTGLVSTEQPLAHLSFYYRSQNTTYSQKSFSWLVDGKALKWISFGYHTDYPKNVPQKEFNVTVTPDMLKTLYTAKKIQIKLDQSTFLMTPNQFGLMHWVYDKMAQFVKNPPKPPSASKAETALNTAPEKPASAPPPKPPTGNLEAKIETDRGTIIIKLFPDVATTTENFIELVNRGFYDGLTFHRYVPGFVIQGGDPTGKGAGGSGKTIPLEISSHKHIEGAVAMARTNDPNSASSQFYICLAAQPELDGKYAVFGQVIQGMPVVMTLRQGDKMKISMVK